MADLTARGLRFNVLQMGQGDRLVVFIHGLVIDNLSSWYMTIAPALAESNRVILYDLRGHGRSERVPSGYSLDEHVLDLAAVLEALGLGAVPLTLVGNSAGGLIALLFAMRFPDRVERLVLLDAHTGGKDVGESLVQAFRTEDGRFATDVKALADAWIEEQRLSPQGRDATGLLKAVDIANVSSNRRNPLVTKMRSLLEDTTLLADLAATREIEDETLAGVLCPTLAIYGEESDLLAEGRRLARTLPGCTLSVIPRGAHFLLNQETVLVREALLGWLR